MPSTYSSPAPRPEILIARALGACFGVRRAVSMVEAAAAGATSPITMLGPLVHNPAAQAALESVGVRSAQRLGSIDEGTVVFSAHGVTPQVRLEAATRALRVLDTTCPFVTKVHSAAKRLVSEGYQLVLVGDKDHSEVRGICGAVDDCVTVIATVDEAEHVPLANKVGVVSQTTQRAADFGAIVGRLSSRVRELKVINTICGATDSLQDAARELARKVDLVIVIGGEQSANTRRLVETCRDEGAEAHRVETADDVQPEWIRAFKRIGITAGASTPDDQIEAVVAKVNGGTLPDGFHIERPAD